MRPIAHLSGCPLGDAWHPDFGKLSGCMCPGAQRPDPRDAPEQVVRPRSQTWPPRATLDDYDRGRVVVVR